MRFREREDKPKEAPGNNDLGIRLLKVLLIRIYNMIYEVPLKWWEILIASVFGGLMGLGVGVMTYPILRTYIMRLR